MSPPEGLILKKDVISLPTHSQYTEFLKFYTMIERSLGLPSFTFEQQNPFGLMLCRRAQPRYKRAYGLYY